MTEEQLVPEGSVKLISGDNMEFIVDQKEASVSKTIKAMLNSTFLEGKKREIRLPEIKGKILAKVVEYMKQHVKYREEKLKENVPEFKIDDADAIELTLAANYLDC